MQRQRQRMEDTLWRHPMLQSASASDFESVQSEYASTRRRREEMERAIGADVREC